MLRQSKAKQEIMSDVDSQGKLLLKIETMTNIIQGKQANMRDGWAEVPAKASLLR